MKNSIDAAADFRLVVDNALAPGSHQREVLTCSMEVNGESHYIRAGALVVALGIHPAEDVARETVDLVEVNHFYDEQGRLVFDQTIFFDWSAEDSRYMVRAWRLVKNSAQLPQRDWAEGGYLSIWHDGEVLRHVRATSIRETWTQYDPELVEREYLPKERRKELRIVKVDRKDPRTVPQPHELPRPAQPSSSATASANVGGM